MESVVEQQLLRVKAEEQEPCREASLHDLLGEIMDTGGSRPTISEQGQKHNMAAAHGQFTMTTMRPSPAAGLDPSRLTPYKNCSSGSGLLHRGGDPVTAGDQAGLKSGSGRPQKSAGAGMTAAVSPEYPHSTSGTPNSITQLLAAFSGCDSSALDFPSPLGSGFASPLSSAKLGRKRALSISPLSTGSGLDLSALIRSSPTSLLNYITASRGSSAGSMGHLSPSIFINPTPHRQHVLLRHTPQPMQQPQTANEGEVNLDVAKLKLEPVAVTVDEAAFPGVYKDALKTLETVREEDGGCFDDEERHSMAGSYTRTVECDSTTRAGNERGSESGCEGGPDPESERSKGKRRVYYTYPNTEVPHNNQCLWSGCNVQYATLDELVRHVNVDHIYRDSKKDFVCCWEGCVRERKAFKAQYMLLVHMRRHTGEKPHQCTFEGCHKAYSRLENLKTHLRSHTGEKPYTCKYKGCDKSFSNASDCAKHMNRTHSDEKPYACPNPGCAKRYTDPSSRRKHVKNCQVGKKTKAEDAMSGADEESCTEGAQSIPPPPGKQPKPTAGQGKKAEKPNKKKKMADSDQNLRAGATPMDHGYETGGSQGYVSSHTGYSSSGYDTEYPSLKDDDIHRVIHHRPPHHVTSPIGHAPNQHHLPMNRPFANKTVRQNGTVPAPKQAPPSYGALPPASSRSLYHAYPDPLLSEGCLPGEQQSQCMVHYTVPVVNGHQTRYTEQGPAYVTVSVQRRFGADVTSSGYSSLRSISPAKGDQRGPAEDATSLSNSGNGAFSNLKNALMTNSRSTFSSTSSRASTPSSNVGRGEVKPLPPLTEGEVLPPKTPPHAGHLWKHASSGGQYLKRSMDERSERSWRSYSSHSSRYSVSGSELSDELLESLPTTGALRNTFTKIQPLPLPESMQSLGRPFAMDCGTLDVFSGMQGTFPPEATDVTLPLHHYGNDALPYDEQCLFSDNIPISQSQLLLADGLLSDTFAGDAGSNMVIGDMASITTALTCESRHYWEGMLQHAD